MNTLDKFKFSVDPTSLRLGRAYRVYAYWSAPSGKTYSLGEAPARDYAGDDTATITRGEFPLLHQELVQRLAQKWRLTNSGQWLRGLYFPSPYVHSYRASLSEEGRQQLARVIRQFMREQNLGHAEEVADTLNEIEAPPEILRLFPRALQEYGSGEIQHGDCGHFHTRSWGAHTPGGTVCQSCIDDGDYVQAEDDGYYYPPEALYRHSDDNYYTYEEEDVEADEESEDSAGMRGYSADVTAVLHGPRFASTHDGPFTIGVELEVYARRGYRSSFVSTIKGQVGEQVICKHDGSLDEDRGVELVTVPLTFESAVDLFRDLEFPAGTTAWNAESCGMHVHIDSRAFTPLSIAKFMAFWNEKDNGPFIREVAGRHPDFDSQAEDYAARVEASGSVLQKAKHHEHGASRYRIVNLCNLRSGETARLKLGYNANDSHSTRNTVELRVFRATLRKARLLAQIEFAAASVYFARDTSVQAVAADHFRAWLSRHTARFPHLASFMQLTRTMRPNPKQAASADEPILLD